MMLIVVGSQEAQLIQCVYTVSTALPGNRQLFLCNGVMSSLAGSVLAMASGAEWEGVDFFDFFFPKEVFVSRQHKNLWGHFFIDFFNQGQRHARHFIE